MIVHAGLVALRLGGRWRGALIEGPSGSGKSDLALRALEAGFRTAADDRVVLWASEGRLFGRAPETLSGLLEVRGVDIVRIEPLAFCEVLLAVELGQPERLPEPEWRELAGVRVRTLRLDPFELSAPAKLGHALAAFDAGLNRRI